MPIEQESVSVGVGGGWVILPPPPPFLVNSETVKAATLALSVFSKILLEMFVQNLVFFTRPSLQILGKTQTGVFPISGFLVNPL